MPPRASHSAPTLPLHTPFLVGRHRRNPTRRPNDLSAPSPASSGQKEDNTPIETVIDVSNWLHSLGFSEYVDVFASNDIDVAVLKTLTSEELRDDLTVTNLRHRRDLLDAVAKLVSEDTSVKKEPLPEHGRILDHLSNVRTYHSWLRVGVQLLGFSIVTLRLAPNFRDTPVVSAASFYYACVGVIALLYGVFRYRAVIRMIERSGARTSLYTPDRAGVISMLILVLIASILSLVLISLRTS